MKTFFLLICVVLSQAVPYYKEWKLFKTIHGKQYGTAAEEQYRMKVFYKNKQMIDEHNKMHQQGLTTFTMAMNPFGDLTLNEFTSLMNGFKMNKLTRKSFGSTFVPTPNLELPETVDWREKGAVTEVKNQQRCGSCYAFSSTGALEGQYFIKHNKLTSLSEQQIVDCCYSNGCRGGVMDDVFEYIKQVGGIDPEQAYPYTAEEDTCKFNKSAAVTTDKGYVDVSEGDELALKEVVATIGPTSVGIDGSRGSFQFYSGGIYMDENCSQIKLSHAVLAVGYGREQGEDYWLLKNSWGTQWGIDGYVKMARNKDNHCGIASSASFPIL